RSSWIYLCCAGLALSPFVIISGIQFLPAVPAAAFLSFSMLLANRRKFLLAGFLAGVAVLFRAELVLIPAVLFFFSFQSRLREWRIFTAGAVIAVLPVIILNISSGTGPVIAVNGAENLWLGTDWELLSTPPGTEFEELVAIGEQEGGGDSAFLKRAYFAIESSPLKWFGMGMQKILAFFTLPGPGRNLETGWLLKKTLLILMLPLSLMAIALGSVRCFDKNRVFWHDLAVSIILAGVISAFVFFPSARFRLTAIPAFWFLSASAFPERKHLRSAGLAALVIILISLFITYPGMVRSGLTSTLAAEHMIESGNPAGALEELDYAENRGFYGADLHNLTGVSYSLLGYHAEGLTEFERAIDIAPESPTLWKNYAVSLWANGKYHESVHAARRAVNLNPLLREQLEPILVHAENI
ncbi:MAG: tetratricopeptide repeat protein, partial [Candidatus Aegiribacteria sp.]|nr:tetratricopeptide repeat protein [Candidatus Aegiribacteria sp.]